MFCFGLKLWSTNKNYTNDIVRLFDKKIFDYIELYSFPESYSDTINLWKQFKIPFVVHAPHFTHGMNLSDKKYFEKNIILANEAKRYADDLHADKIIFHPGAEGRIEETVRQLKIINDGRILIENKPHYSNDGKYLCVGHTPEEISFAMSETGYRFCLDFAHAILSAKSKKIEPLSYIKEFIKLKPAMFHLCDGEVNELYDSHYRYGKGNYPLKDIFKLLPQNAVITTETNRDSKDNLNDFEQDILYLKSLF